MIVFNDDAGINGPLVEVVQFLDLGHDVIFDGFGQRDIVRDEDQFHGTSMLPAWCKIQ
jgi:hypothetical protein